MKLRNRIGSIFVHIVLLYSVSILKPSITFVSASGNETDKVALLKFKDSISGDPDRVLSSWNDSVHFCNWRGVSCSDQSQRITALDLGGYNLRGTLSPFIGNFSFLRLINLEGNSLSGGIPKEVGYLSRLQHLNLSNNPLGGNIPINLSLCSQLTVLNLESNRLVGNIPSELGSLGKLVYLSLHENDLTGTIPAALGNISTLVEFVAGFNNLHGNIPHELGRLKSLTSFVVGANKLTGEIPLSLYNISSMKELSLVDNKFSGILPSNIGLTLSNLEFLAMGGNKFSGVVPESLSNASQLQKLDLGGNSFFGQVPKSLGNLQNLQWFSLSSNGIGDYAADSLDFIAYLANCSQLEHLDLSFNSFAGVLPNTIFNLSTKLQKLDLGVNHISGTIPSSLENLVNLILLGMGDTLLDGVIPSSLGKLQNLQILDLEGNAFSGMIPSSIGNLTRIVKLSLAYNELEGSIPSSIFGCQSLTLLDISHNKLSGAIPREVFGLSSLSIFLNLSQNSFTGSLPKEIGQLKNIGAIEVSENNLTNEIPETIGECQSLEYLYLQGNQFLGSLPSSLISLKALHRLDLSRNNLTGQIPNGLEKLSSLQYLNVSFNNLEGEVPRRGVFQNFGGVSLAGNRKLCGGVPQLQLQRCLAKVSKKGISRGLELAIIISCTAAFFLLISSFIFLYWRRNPRTKSSPLPLPTTISFLQKLEYKELYKATNGFSPTMLIGAGSFGSVYKGNLEHEENLVAVKVLNLQRKGADKSFIAECNALRNIRHRNLVKILTCCSSMDYNGSDFKALVFEYMSNGSLENWLHNRTNEERRLDSLSLIQRVNIAIDVASAIQYLHTDCNPQIIHCDLKPSNVLLDSEMIAHVSDFGLARLVSDNNGFSDAQNSTTGIKGTIGYVAPEYATGCKQSKEGDIYSYGILVLEMFTGRRPTDEIFKDDFNLHNFIKMALPERVEQIVDSALLPREYAMKEEDNNNGDNESDEELGIMDFVKTKEMSVHVRNCLVSVMEIGVACSRESPDERMNIGQAIRGLQLIKNAYESVELHRQRRKTRS